MIYIYSVKCRYNAVQFITYGATTTVAESESDFRITIDTPYLALTGKLWDVYCEDFGENWRRYNGTALYNDPNHNTIKWKWNE